MIAHLRVSAVLLVAAGLYTLFQPFAASPWSCISAWGGLTSSVALQNCASNTPRPEPFLMGGFVGVTLIVAAFGIGTQSRVAIRVALGIVVVTAVVCVLALAVAPKAA